METKLDPFTDLVHQFQDSLLQAIPPETDDPKFNTYLDAQVVAKQLSLTQHFDNCLTVDPADDRAAGNLLRALALIERTRARIIRGQLAAQKDAHTALLQLEHSSQPDRAEARAFLNTELTAGARSAQDLIALARSIGISHRTLKRAKSELGVLSELRCTDSHRSWVWSLSKPAALAPSPSSSAG